MTLQISKLSWEAICQHARETFPEECCGVIISRERKEEARRIANMQNALHQEDPDAYPRTATTAYFMNTKELLTLLQEVDTRHLTLKAFYHSHPDHGAYFSAEDKARAMFDNEPAYPDSAYLVLSVYDRQVKEAKAFAWEPAKRDFVAVPFAIE
jgi:[CysO sulfur-carrier protein]-S-L-cysteine hydrolase